MVEGRQFWKTQSELVSQTWLSPSTKTAGLHQCKCLKLWKINTTTIYQTESLTIIKIENMNEKSNFSLLKNENWKFDKKKFWVNFFLFVFFFFFKTKIFGTNFSYCWRTKRFFGQIPFIFRIKDFGTKIPFVNILQIII